VKNKASDGLIVSKKAVFTFPFALFDRAKKKLEVFSGYFYIFLDFPKYIC